MLDAKTFHNTDTLKNGMVVTIRAVRSDDKARINEAFENLEPETIFARYFYHKDHLTAENLKWATELDFINDVAIVATITDNGKEIVIGGSRYSRLNPEIVVNHAEIAFTVEEDYQGLGLASLLFTHMLTIARSQSITAFEAEVLPGNMAMLTVFEKSGLSVTRRREDGYIHLCLQF